MRKATMPMMAALLALVACTGSETPAGTGAIDPRVEPPSAPTRPRPDATTVRAAAVGLVRFDDCASLLEHLHARAREVVTPWGLPEPLPWGFDGVVDAVAQTAIAGDVATANMEAAPGVAPDGSFSTTNVQEAGVDEPDLLKSDGRRIFTIARGRLHAVEVTDGRPRLAGVLELPSEAGEQMLLAGDRVMVFGTRWRVQGSRRSGLVRSSVTIIDVANPAEMRAVRTVEVDGEYVSARLVDGVARVVLRSHPQRIAFAMPGRGSRTSEAEALAANVRRIGRTTLRDWLPRFDLFEHRGADRAPTGGGIIGGCGRVHRPGDFAGVGMVSVLSIDPADPEPRDGATVIADARTVYATARSLYVATNRWALLDRARERPADGEAPAFTTEIHRFDITNPTRARYRSSGRVRGHLLNQWSLSEHEGVLRVATTDWSPGTPDSESFVTILRERGEQLRRIGQVGGLGRGERIYAVRFLGDVGYVVTFRQIDPLYTIDLSDPTAPRVTGELKIPGYSAYLHPVGDGLLLGVGQDATERGGLLGLQVSLFDVSDPATPRRVARKTLGGDSEAELDHHAFLWWPAERRAVIPMRSWTEEGVLRSHAALLAVTDRTIERVATLEHVRGTMLDGRAAIRRSAVIGDTLFTASSLGMMGSRVRDGARRAWVGWPPRFVALETLAGSGARGLRDGHASEARFNRPAAVAVAGDGTIVIADRGNRRLRLLDARRRVRQIAFTMAGRPAQRHEQLPGRPRGVAFAGNDTLYLTTGCALWRLERVHGDATLHHVAGTVAPDGECPSSSPSPADGRGLLARFGGASQIAVAADGAIIVADMGAHAIRRVVVGSDGVGSVSTMAGSLGTAGHADGDAASALFRAPSAVTITGRGDAIVADTGNDMLRRIHAGSGRVQTVARALLDPTGVAYDPSSDAVYIAERSGVRLRALHRDRLWATHTRRMGSVEGATGVAMAPEGLIVTLAAANRLALLVV